MVIYEVSKTLYTPTHQRAGLAPRNPVLALTHRYLSHDHFRPICAHTEPREASVHTQRATSTLLLTGALSSSLDVSAFTIYSAPRVGDAVGYLVDIVYPGLTLLRWPVIPAISLLNVTYPPVKRQPADFLAATVPLPKEQMARRHASSGLSLSASTVPRYPFVSPFLRSPSILLDGVQICSSTRSWIPFRRYRFSVLREISFTILCAFRRICGTDLITSVPPDLR